MKRRPRRRMAAGQIGIVIILSMTLAITLYPFLYTFANSVSDPMATIRNEVYFWPKGFQLNTYRQVLRTKSFLSSYGNTVWYTVVGTVVSTTVIFLASYPLSRKEFFLRKQMNTFFIITMYFSGGMVPLFIVVNKLGLYNNRLAIILPVAANVYYMIICRSFMDDIPDSMIESAKLDGANDVQILKNIVLGVSKPIIAVLVLFTAVGYWNTYFNAVLYLPSPELQPLQIYLNKLLVNNSVRGGGNAVGQMGLEASLNIHQFKYAAIIVTILPIVCVYPFVQKYFVKGVMIGAVKG